MKLLLPSVILHFCLVGGSWGGAGLAVSSRDTQMAILSSAPIHHMSDGDKYFMSYWSNHSQYDLEVLLSVAINNSSDGVEDQLDNKELIIVAQAMMENPVLTRRLVFACLCGPSNGNVLFHNLMNLARLGEIPVARPFLLRLYTWTDGETAQKTLNYAVISLRDIAKLSEKGAEEKLADGNLKLFLDEYISEDLKIKRASTGELDKEVVELLVSLRKLRTDPDDQMEDKMKHFCSRRVSSKRADAISGVTHLLQSFGYSDAIVDSKIASICDLYTMASFGPITAVEGLGNWYNTAACYAQDPTKSDVEDFVYDSGFPRYDVEEMRIHMRRPCWLLFEYLMRQYYAPQGYH